VAFAKAATRDRSRSVPAGVDEIMEAVNAYQRRLINPLEEVMAELRRNAPSQLNGFKRRF
jgi:hypothetical protein